MNNPIAMTPSIINTLFSVLKGWAQDQNEMDAFRYEMFARRLVAAEYGRPDAVAWVLEWYAELQREQQEQEAEAQRLRMLHEASIAADRARFLQGSCSNPRYQAFLDTVEHPDQLKTNAPYMAWISSLLGRLERLKGYADLTEEERRTILDRFVQEERDANLAPRLRRQHSDQEKHSDRREPPFTSMH